MNGHRFLTACKTAWSRVRARVTRCRRANPAHPPVRCSSTRGTSTRDPPLAHCIQPPALCRCDPARMLSRSRPPGLGYDPNNRETTRTTPTITRALIVSTISARSNHFFFPFVIVFSEPDFTVQFVRPTFRLHTSITQRCQSLTLSALATRRGWPGDTCFGDTHQRRHPLPVRAPRQEHPSGTGVTAE